MCSQDFALDPEDHALHDAAQKMVRNLTAGMVMITCREPLLTSITNHLKNSVSNEITARVVSSSSSTSEVVAVVFLVFYLSSCFVYMWVWPLHSVSYTCISIVCLLLICVLSFLNPIQQYNPADAHNRALIEPACNQAAAENVEAACVFIQKTAVEKVVSEMEKRIADVCGPIDLFSWCSIHMADYQSYAGGRLCNQNCTSFPRHTFRLLWYLCGRLCFEKEIEYLFLVGLTLPRF